MSAGVWFWILYVLCVVFGLYLDWPNDKNYRPFGSRIIVFILIGLLGWGVFGPPIR